MSEITTKINRTIEKYNMLQSGDFVVAGVSGGADSMLLLNALVSMKNELNLRILAANVEHGIRGEESKRDTQFVCRYCSEKGIDFVSLSIDAPNEAKRAGLGIEEYSRKRRYEFFSSFDSDKIATAHNLSDNVETVLFRLIRGTSLKGCCGIPPVRGKIIRPLIECTSDEIREACRDFLIPYVTDSTNADNSYSRNYIRNVVIPDMEKLNPSLIKSVSRFIENTNEQYGFIKQQGEKCFNACNTDKGLDLAKLKKYNKTVIKHSLKIMLSDYLDFIDEKHLNGVFALIYKSGKYQIKNSIFAVSNGKYIRAARFDDAENFDNLKFSKKTVQIEDFLNNCELFKKEFEFYCDYDKIIGSLCIRQRQEGDRISPLGRGCTKSLKKLFNELKIPIEKRNGIPVIADDLGVIGVAGLCCDERVGIDKNTQRVVLINVTED